MRPALFMALTLCLSHASAQTPWFDDYKTLAEYNAKLDEFAAEFPELTTLSTIGQSWEGRDIRMIKVTGTGGGPHKKAVALNSLQHAREWITGMANMYVTDQLLQGYGSDTRITHVMDEVEFFIIPVVNPDGYEFSQQPFRRLWRKNRRVTGPGSIGVDLNRNWGYEWGDDAGSSGNLNSDTYRGDRPFSELETQAMRDFFIANQNIVTHSDIHSYGQLILTPWGYTEDELPPDHDLLQQLSGRMADSMFEVHGKVYEYGPTVPLLYVLSGGSHDWAYGDQGVYSTIVELRPDSPTPGFDLPPQEIIPTGEELLPAILDMAEFTARLASGDFNDDFTHNCDDVDRLYDAILNGSNKAEFDLNGDGEATADDLTVWLAEAGEANLASGTSFLPADADLNGTVDGRDFLVWNDHKFTNVPSFCSGDFNADGLVDGSDFVIWNDFKFQDSAFGVVPEPTSALSLCCLTLLGFRWPHHRVAFR